MISLQPSTSPAARTADSERKPNTTHRSSTSHASTQETISAGIPREHVFLHLQTEPAQFCGHKKMKGKALIPELTTLQWWPSTEVPSALTTGCTGSCSLILGIPRQWGCFPASHALVCGSTKAASHLNPRSGFAKSTAAEEKQPADSPGLLASSHSAVVPHPVKAVTDVLLTVHSHLAQPDHSALRDVLLQLTLHHRHQPRLLAGLRPPHQHIAGVTAALEQRGWNRAEGTAQHKMAATSPAPRAQHPGGSSRSPPAPPCQRGRTHH